VNHFRKLVPLVKIVLRVCNILFLEWLSSTGCIFWTSSNHLFLQRIWII